MSKKTFTLLLFIFSILGFGIGYVLTNSIQYSLCYVNLQTNTFDASCIDYFEKLGNPLFYGMGALAAVFLVLFFVPRAFSAWKKFAVWFVPAAAIIFIFYGNPGSGDLFSPYPEQVFRWVSELYIALSLGIIAYAGFFKKSP